MLITPAYAQTGGGSLGLINLVPLILIFVIMYFLLIRPQQRKVKQHKIMVSELRRGDWVITQGGIVGRITRVKDDNEVEVEIDSEQQVRVRLVRNMVTNVIEKSGQGE